MWKLGNLNLKYFPALHQKMVTSPSRKPYTCFKPTVEPLGKGMKYVKTNNIDTEREQGEGAFCEDS